MRQSKLGEYPIKKPKFKDTLLVFKKNTFFHKIYYRLIDIALIYKNRKTLKYSAISFSGEIIDFSVLYLLTSFLGLYYILSAVISYTLAIFSNYFLNKKFTFKYVSPNLKQQVKDILSYFFVSLTGLIINISLLAFVVEVIGLHYLLAKILVNFLVFIYVYSGHSFIFRKKIIKLSK
jgi:putative flippase GtrA